MHLADLTSYAAGPAAASASSTPTATPGPARRSSTWPAPASSPATARSPSTPGHLGGRPVPGGLTADLPAGVRRLFSDGFRAADVAEPLASFDAETAAKVAAGFMAQGGFSVAGVRRCGRVVGYVEQRAGRRSVWGLHQGVHDGYVAAGRRRTRAPPDRPASRARTARSPARRCRRRASSAKSICSAASRPVERAPMIVLRLEPRRCRARAERDHLDRADARRPSPCCRPWCRRARSPARCVSVVRTPNAIGHAASASETVRDALGDLAGDVVEVRRRAADDARASAMIASTLASVSRRARAARRERDLPRAGHADDRDVRRSSPPWRASASSAPSTRRSTMKWLKRLATMREPRARRGRRGCPRRRAARCGHARSPGHGSLTPRPSSRRAARARRPRGRSPVRPRSCAGCS